MKKSKLLSLLLALILSLQCAAFTVSAEDPEESSSAETGETTVPAETEAPARPDFQVPTGVQGNAAQTNGCVGLDAQRPLGSKPDLLQTAKGAFLYEMNTGTLVYAKNPDEKLYPASLTKVMTCMLALEKGNLHQIVTVSESAISNMDPEGSTANLVAGEELSFENLLYCLMVSSANDAGAVLAEQVAGSQEAFVEMMNQRARELGCTGTHFANPHGLHDDQHYTTPRDMAKIMMAALESEKFREIYATPVYSVPATNKSEARTVYSTNYLITQDPIDYYYDSRFIGGKTGFTTPAGRCLMVTSQQEDSDFRFLSVVMGTEATVDEDGYTILRYGSFEETVDLVDYGFDCFTTAEAYQKGQTVDQFPVKDGENSVTAEPAEVLKVILPEDFDPDDITLSASVPEEGLSAPIDVGEKIGTFRVWYRDICVAETELLSQSVSREECMNSIFSGGVITEEEDAKIMGFIRKAIKVFLILVGVVVILTVLIGAKNLIVGMKRRHDRKNRRKNRRRSR